MTQRSRYILIEAAIGAAFSAALSLFFVLVLFGGEARIPVLSLHGIVADAAPQSFMIVLMSNAVPRMLLRHRLGAGRLAGVAPRTSVGAILLQSAALAVIAAAALVAVQAVILPMVTPATWPLGAVIAYKLGYGGALGGATAGLVVSHGLGVRHDPGAAPHRSTVP